MAHLGRRLKDSLQSKATKGQ